MVLRAAPRGIVTNLLNAAGEIKDGIIGAGKMKVVVRDMSIGVGAATATATNAADIGGIVLGAHFIAASPDTTATEIRSVRFVPATGALTVAVNANTTAATVVRVVILQA